MRCLRILKVFVYSSYTKVPQIDTAVKYTVDTECMLLQNKHHKILNSFVFLIWTCAGHLSPDGKVSSTVYV